MAASGVLPLFVLPNMSAIFRGRYVCASMNTLRDATYSSVLL